MTNYDICNVDFNEAKGMEEFNGEIFDLATDESKTMPSLVRDVQANNESNTRLFNLRGRR